MRKILVLYGHHFWKMQDRLPVKFQDVKFKDSKLKYDIFMRIDMKHSYFSNNSSVVV